MNTPQPDPAVLERAEQVAVQLAREAGGLLRDKLYEPRDVHHKGTVDLVTDADKASEAVVAEGIRKAFPDHRLIAEEGSRGADTSSWGWVIDPLDGTTNYAHRYPNFSVSIALEFETEPVLGVIYDPMRDELFHAKQGGGAFLNDTPIRVSGTTELIQGLMASGFAYQHENRQEMMKVWVEIADKVQSVRRAGAASLDACYVAAGRIDGYFERPVNAWDIGAAVTIIREAGGQVTSLSGGAFDLYGGEIIATNGLLHPALVDTIGSILGL